MRLSAGLVVAALLAPAAASAQGILFTRTGSGARAAGMANAFIGISDDGTAASWNPAGLAQLRKPELSVVSSTVGRSFRAEGFRTRDDTSTFTPFEATFRDTFPDFASLAVPVTLWGKPVTFQGSWHRLYALDLRQVSSTTVEPLTAGAPPPLRIDSNLDTAGSVDFFSVAGAVRLTPHLSLGTSVNFWRGDWDDSAAYTYSPLTTEQPSTYSAAAQTNRVRGTNVGFGLMLTYPRWSVGAAYQTELSSDYSGVGRLTSSTAPPSEDVPFQATLRFPQEFGAGVAWRPASRWTVALDFTWDEWSQSQIEVAGMPPMNIFDGQPPDRTSSRDTVSINAGAEHLFVADRFVIPLRFGLAWEPQGWRSPYTRDPVSFAMVAVGTGYNTNSVKLDGGLQLRFAHFQDGTSFEPNENPLLPLAVGERDLTEWRLKLSLILRVPDTEKIGEVIHKVF